MAIPEVDPREIALFLDFDGTLVGIADKPDLVAVAAELPPLLTGLSDRLGGALAIVTGRTLADVDRYLRSHALTAAGQHGLEMRLGADHHLELAKRPDSLDRLVARLEETGIANGGVELEHKPFAVVVHYRGNPDAEAAIERFLREALADQEELHMLSGKAVFEVKVQGMDKGTAVGRLMEESAFSGRKPVFIGDDVTDEDGFRAAASIGGFGVKVGSGDTVAPYRLPDVDSVHAWLARLHDG